MACLQTATSEGMKGAGEHQASPLQTRALCDDIAGRDDNPQMMPLDDAGPSSPPAENNDEVLHYAAPCFPDGRLCTPVVV